MKKAILLSVAVVLHSCALFGQVPTYVSSDSLKVWFPFNGNANDESGHGNNGTSYGATLTTDRFGIANKAYLFNGTSDYIQGATIANFTNMRNTTVAAWLYYTGDAGATPYDTYFHYGSPGAVPSSHSFAYAYDYSTQSLALYSHCFLPNSTYIPKNLNNNWHHVVVVDSYTTTKVYVDDTMIHSWVSGDTMNCFTGSSMFFIGANTGDNQYVTGKVDDIGVWSRALTSCEISRLYFGTGSTGLITRSPSNDTCMAGGTATFSISDTGAASGYQWQKDAGSGYVNLVDGTPYSGVTTKVLSISPVTSAMNNYRFRCVRGVAEAVNSCIDTSGFAVLTLNTSGIPFERINQAIVVAPNPVSKTITVVAPITIDKLEIVNMLGQCVLFAGASGSTVELDLTDLAKGVYLLRINDAFVKRVVKE